MGTELWKKWTKARENAAKVNSHGIESIEKVRNEVSHEEKKILYRFGAMRMYVIHFTNGTETDAGLPLIKISFHHEVLEDYYVEPIAKHFRIEQTLPEMFISPVKHVVRTGRFFLEQVDEAKAHLIKELEENPTNVENQQRLEHCNWLLGYKIKCVLWLALRNKSGKIVAIQVMHFPSGRAIDTTDIPKIVDMKKSIEDIYNRNQK